MISFFLVEETRVPGENHRSAGSHQQTLSLLYRVHLPWVGFELPTLVVIGSEYIASYKNIHLPYDHDHYVYWHWGFLGQKRMSNFTFISLKCNFTWLDSIKCGKKTSVQFYIRPKNVFFLKYVSNFLSYPLRSKKRLCNLTL